MKGEIIVYSQHTLIHTARYFEYKEVLLVNKKKPGDQREKWEEDSKKHSKQKK